MGFQKNNSFGSRTKRGKSKISKDLREVSAMILDGEMDNLKNRLPSLKDGDYIKAIGLLMKHVLPAQKQVEMDIEQEEITYQVEIIDRIDQVTKNQAKEVLKGISDDAYSKMKKDKYV